MGSNTAVAIPRKNKKNQNGCRGCSSDPTPTLFLEKRKRQVYSHSWSLSIEIPGLNPVIGIFFKKMGQTRPLFCLFSFFSQYKDKYSTNLTINDKSVDCVLGSGTWDGRMQGTIEST